MKDDQLMFSMMLSFRIKKNVSAQRLSAVLVTFGLDGGDVLDRENWVKRCQNILQLSDSFKTGFAPSSGVKPIKLRTALGSCSNMTVFIFDVSQAKTTYQGASFKNHKSLWLPCFVRYVTETGES